MMSKAIAALGIVPVLLLSFISDSAGGAVRTLANDQLHKREQITVRIRNGRTGRPVWAASPYVYVGRVDTAHMAQNRRPTVLWKDAHVDVTGANLRRVVVLMDMVDRDCQYATNDGSMQAIADLDLDLALAKGFVGRNFCGSKSQAPEPGVITLYVLPETSKELRDR